MRLWIILMTVCSLLSLPFSGSMAADSAHHSEMMQAAPAHAQHMATSTSGTSESNTSKTTSSEANSSEHCPESMPAVEMADDCCDDNSSNECGSCPPDCGHCAMSDHGSSAALPMQQTFTPSVVSAPVTGKSSFYQRLSGQPTPPPIIS